MCHQHFWYQEDGLSSQIKSSRCHPLTVCVCLYRHRYILLVSLPISFHFHSRVILWKWEGEFPRARPQFNTSEQGTNTVRVTVPVPRRTCISLLMLESNKADQYRSCVQRWCTSWTAWRSASKFPSCRRRCTRSDRAARSGWWFEPAQGRELTDRNVWIWTV